MSERNDPVTVELRQIGKGRWAATVETDDGPITVESDSIEDLHEYALAAARAGTARRSEADPPSRSSS